MCKEILERIAIASKADPRSEMTISDKLVKLQEEIGEIAAAHMKERGLKPLGEGETQEVVRVNKKEEYADALLVLLDLVLADGFTFEEINEHLDIGVTKWYNKVAKIQEKQNI